MLHKGIKLTALLFLGLGLMELHAQNMLVTQNNGNQTTYDLINIRKLTFESGNITITKKDNSTNEFALNGLRNMRFTNTVTGISEPATDISEGLYAYPNPVQNTLNIDLSGIENSDGTLSILNLDGRLMQTNKITGSGILSMDMSQLPQGIYFCRYTNGTVNKTKKFIKQ